MIRPKRNLSPSRLLHLCRKTIHNPDLNRSCILGRNLVLACILRKTSLLQGFPSQKLIIRQLVELKPPVRKFLEHSVAQNFAALSLNVQKIEKSLL